jgi:hypothetical protein
MGALAGGYGPKSNGMTGRDRTREEYRYSFSSVYCSVSSVPPW